MRIAALAVVALSCVFYLFIFIQFTREQRRSKRKANSLTYLGTREAPRDSFPVKRYDRPHAEQNSQSKRKLVPISRRPAAKSPDAASQTKWDPIRLPYVEITLPISAVATPVTTAGEELHSGLLRKRRA
jgi:hypothetical protein